VGIAPAFFRDASPFSGIEALPLRPEEPRPDVSSGTPARPAHGTSVSVLGRMGGLLELPPDPVLAGVPATPFRKWKVALLASCVLHAAVAGFFLFGADDAVLIEGSQEAGVVMLGNATENDSEAGDAAAGLMQVTLVTMLDATAVETVDAEAIVETIDAAQQPVLDRQEAIVEAAAVEPPVETAAAQPAPPTAEARPDASQAAAVARIAPAAAEPVRELLTAQTVEPMNENVVPPQPDMRAAQSSPPVETAEARPVEPEKIGPIAEPQPKKETRPEPEKAEKPKAAPKAEPKPKETSKKAAEKPAKAKETRTTTKAETEPGTDKAKSGSAGKGKTNAKKGVAEGEREGKVARKGAAGKGAAGNASVSNYPGKVVAKLRRSLRGIPRSAIRQARNDVQVGFTVGANGSVSGVRITRSSGSATLDQAALQVVRRAAPFPPIPAEAGRSSWAFAVPLGIAR
jgi:protein TonB